MRFNNHWIGGLFDGEGYVGLVRFPHKKSPTGYNFVLSVSIANQYKPILSYLKNIFGGSIYKGKQETSCYYWKLTAKRATAFLKYIQPYCIIKAEQIKTAIECHETTQMTGLGSTNRYKDVVLEREKYYYLLKKQKRSKR